MSNESSPPLRICTLNVLCPELLFFFWRGSYGLPLLDSEISYEKSSRLRFDNIIRVLETVKPDILCLQEISDSRFPSLDFFPTPEYLGRRLGLQVAGRSFKGAEMIWGFPPREQSRNAPQKKFDSGVATLYNPKRLDHAGQLGKAESHGQSSIFRTGWGSPFTVDAFEVKGWEGPQFHVVNTHIRMVYPNILKPLTEFFQRVNSSFSASKIDWDRVVLCGDLNASSTPASEDFKIFLAAQSALVDMPLGGSNAGGSESAYGGEKGETLKPRDDHILLSKGIVAPLGCAQSSLAPLLVMSTQDSKLSTSDASLWGVEGTQYTIHAGNSALLNEGGQGTSDHPLIYADIAIQP